MENLSILELKALAYDEIALINYHQQRLADFNALIQKKQDEEKNKSVSNDETT